MLGLSRNTFKRRYAGLSLIVLTAVLFTGLASSMIWPQFQAGAGNTGFLDTTSIYSNIEGQSDACYNNAGQEYQPHVDVAIGQDKVFCTASSGYMEAFHRNNFSNSWSDSISQSYAAPVVGQDYVYAAGGIASTLYKYDKSSGTRVDSTSLGNDLATVYGIAEKDGLLFLADFDDDGSTVLGLHSIYKENLTVKDSYDGGEVKSSPAVTDSTVVVTEQSGDVVAYSRDTQSEIWREPIGTGADTSRIAPTIYNGKVFAVNNGGEISAFDLSDGTRLWESPQEIGNVYGSPAIENGSLYIGDGNSEVFQIDTQTGSILNQTTTGGLVAGSPAITDDFVLVSSRNSFHAYNRTLSPEWTYTDLTSQQYAFYSGVTIADGEIYFGTGQTGGLTQLTGESPDVEPPEISDTGLVDQTDGNGVLNDGETVRVYADVTDESDIASVTADLSAFGAGSSVELENETWTGINWDDEGGKNNYTYGADVTVDTSAIEDGASKSVTVTATDSQGNTGTSSEFGSLTVDTEAPIFDSINVSLIGTANPIFEANISANLSGLDQSDTELKLNDTSGDVLSGSVAGLSGVSAPQDKNITFDMTQRLESFADGSVTVNITPEDVAGNTGDTVLKNFVVDTTPPQDMSIDSPVSKTFLKSSENFTVEYSYTEPHPETTTVSIVDQDGNVDASISVDESGEDADSSVEFNLDNASYSITPGEMYDVQLSATDQVDNSDTITEEKLLAVDDTPPELNNSEKLSDTEFNFSVSDNLGLNASSVEASDFEFRTSGVSGTFSVGPCSDEDTVCDVQATLDSEVDIYEVTVGLKSGESVSDLAGNIQSSDTVTVEKMDGVPPEIEAFRLEDMEDGNGFVSGGDAVRVYANVTDGVKVSSVTANMTEFGVGDKSLESEASGSDWNDDGSQDQEVYGADIVLPESVEDMDNASSWITAEDNSSNSNTTPEFGELEIDDTPPEIGIDNPLKQNPRYIQPGDSLEVNFTYTEKNPEALNISVGSEFQIFESFSSGTDIDANRTVEASSLPGEGEYELNLTMNDSAGLEGSDNQSSSVFIDGTNPENVSDLSHYDETADSGYDDDMETNFTWTAATDEISGVDYYNVFVSTDGGVTFSEAYTTENTNYTVSTADGDEAQVKVQAVDRSGNEGFNKSSSVIQVDTVPPEASIYDPLAEDDIVNSSEQNSFKVNGTIQNDLDGEVIINVSDLSNNVSDTFSFSEGEFSGQIDVSGLNDGSISVEVSPTDQAGNTGNLASTQVTKDTQPPTLNEAYKINSTAFNATFSDSMTGLDKTSIVKEELGLDYGSIQKVDTENMVSGENLENATVLLSEEIDSETLNFSVTGKVLDVAGNVLDSGWATVNDMDYVPPDVKDTNLSDMDGDGVVQETDRIQVYAGVTDGTGVASVEANLSGFGDSLSSVSLESEQASDYDWNDDGDLASDVYGANATVKSSAESGTQSAKVTVTDTSSNSNTNTTEAFGSLEVIKEAPEIDVEDPLESTPAYVKPSEDLEVTFNYTEDDPDELNISVGSQNQIFTGLQAGENLEKTEIFSSENLPSNGTYDLALNLTNTVGLQGNDSEASAVVVDEYAPSSLSVDSPASKQYRKSSENFSVNYSYTEVNPDWTEVRLVNKSGDVGLKKNVSEASQDPDGQVKFEDLGNLDEAVNYTVEVEAGDKAGWTSVVEEENLMIVDDTAPILQNPRKISDSNYRFDIYDEASGISSTGLNGDDFELRENVRTDFAVTCSTGRLNCTVDVDILEETNNIELVAGLTDSEISTVSDLAGNTRSDDEVTLQDTDTMAPGLESFNLNVSTPVNNSYSPGAVNVTLKFNESMDTSQDPTVVINNLASSYTVSGDYFNSTHWAGTFDIKDDDENTEAYVNISQAYDEAGNIIDSNKDSDKFRVDTEEPEITVENNFRDENHSDTVDLSQYFSENTDNGGIDSYEFNDGTGWAEIDFPTSWDSSEASSGEVDFRVNATDTTENSESVTVTSTVDNSPPAVEEAYIRIEDDSAEQGVLNDGDNFSIEVKASDVDTAVETVQADVSEVTGLEGFVDLEKDQDGNFSGVFTVNNSADIENYSPGLNVSDIEGNYLEASTDNSVAVDSVPVEINPAAIYTFLETDRFDNGVANPGDEINVSWNSTENGIDNIKNVTVNFGEFGGIVEASDLSGDGVYSAVLEISEGDQHDVSYSGNVTVNTLSGEKDNETDDSAVDINNDVPSAPTSFEASAQSGGAIELTWNGVFPGDLDGYRIYRNSSQGFQELDTTGATTYTDNSAIEGNEYVYKVSAFDTAENEGPNSSEASAVSDATSPEIASAVTYNRTAINVTFEDDYHEVDASSIQFNDGTAVGFNEDGKKVSGLVIKDQFSTGTTPDVSPNVEDTVGNQDFYTTQIEASDGVPPEVQSMSMDDVTADDGTATVEVTYTESMDTGVPPDFGISRSYSSEDSGTWINDTTFSKDYTFDVDDDNATAIISVNNAFDDSGNVQEASGETLFDIDTVVPQPVIEGLSDGTVVKDTVLLNSSGTGYDVESVEWIFTGQGGSNQSIETLDSLQNETDWDTPLSEFETDLWLKYTDDVGNTGVDSVGLEVDNIEPSIQGGLPDFVSGEIDLTSEIEIGSDAESSSYESNDGSGWTEISSPSSWSSTQASEGSVDFRANATDDADNSNSKLYTATIDNTAPGDLSVDSPSGEIFIRPEDGLTVDYSYVEENSANTTVRLFDGDGAVLQKTVDESSKDPDGSVNFGISTLETDNYSIKVYSQDLAGLEQQISTEEIIHLDSENPSLVNGTYYNDTRMSFQIVDNDTGIDNSSLQASDFEVLTDTVEASEFDIVSCESYSDRCTVNVTLKESGGYTAEFGVKSSEQILDRSGNSIQNTVEATDPTAEGPEADISLNVSAPLNTEDAGKTVGLTVNFSKPVDNNQRAYVDFQGAEVEYSDGDTKVSNRAWGSYKNTTHWTGEFKLLDQSQEEDITVHMTNVEDSDGNELIQKDVGAFRIDLNPPELSLKALNENISGTVNLADKLRENSSGVETSSFRYSRESWNDINSPQMWDTTELSDGGLVLEANAEDSAGNTEVIEKELTLDNRDPEIHYAYANSTDGSKIGLGDELEIEVNVSDNGTGIEKVTANISDVSNVTGLVGLEREDENIFSGVFTVNRSVDIADYSPEISVDDYAGNSVQTSSSTVQVNSTETEDEDGSEDTESGGSGGSGGGSSGGGSSGGGGGFLPGIGDENDSENSSENESEDGNDTSGGLNPGLDSLNINITPEASSIELERNESAFYRPEISVSSPATVEVSVEGLENIIDYSDTITVDGSEEVVIEAYGARETGEYTGDLLVAGGDSVGTARITVNIVEVGEEGTDIEVDVENDTVNYRSDLDEDLQGEASVETKVYDVDGNVVRTVTKLYDFNGSNFNGSISLEGVGAGDYTIETVVNTGEKIYSGRETFELPDSAEDNPYISLAIAVAVITGLSALYVHSNSSSSNAGTSHGTGSSQRFGNASSNRSRENRKASTSENVQETEEQEKDPFEDINSMFEDEKVVQDTEEASRLMSEGEMKRAEEKLGQVKESDFLSGNNQLEEIKNRIKDAHRRFRESLNS